GQTLILTNYTSEVLYDSTVAGLEVQIHCVPNPLDPSTDRVVSATALYAGFDLFGIPHSGTYYVELYSLNNNNAGSYVIQSALVTPGAGDVAGDQRDQLLSWSDDDGAWSPPVRVDDSPAGFDGVYPSVAVDGEGRVHCAWMDYRDDPVYATSMRAHSAS